MHGLFFHAIHSRPSVNGSPMVAGVTGTLAPDAPCQGDAHTDRFWQDFHRIEAGTRMKRLVLTRFPRHYNHFRRRKMLTKYGDDLQPFALWHVESMVQNEATDLQESAGPEKPVSKLATGMRPVYHRLLSSLVPEDGLRYAKARLQEGAAAGTIRREWQVLTRILNLAVRYDKMDRNPLKHVDLPDAEKRTRVAEPDELEALRTIKDKDPSKRECRQELWRMIQVALNVGLREGRILGID
jgi:integrase